MQLLGPASFSTTFFWEASLQSCVENLAQAFKVPVFLPIDLSCLGL